MCVHIIVEKGVSHYVFHIIYPSITPTVAPP